MADTSSAHGYGALYYGLESVAFGTEAAAFSYIEVKNWVDGRNQGYHDNDVVKQGLQQHTSGVVGVKSDSTAELEMYMHGYSTSTPVAAPAALHPDAQLLACALGGAVFGGYDGTGIQAGTTDSNLVLSDASSFEAGQAVLVNGEIGWVAAATTYPDSEELALLHDLRAVPDNSDKVYGAITVFPTDAFDATDSPSLSFKWLGLRTDDVVKHLGCRPNSCSIEGAPKDFLTMKMGFDVSNWSRADTGGNPEPLTYSYPTREQIVGARLLLQENTGAIASMEADCSKFSLNFGLGISPKTDLNASQGVAEYRKTATEVILEVDPIQGIESTTAGWEFNFNAQYQYTAVLQVGTTAGRTISICLPAAELVNFPATADRDGLNAKSLKLRGMAHTRCTGSAGDAYPTNKTCMVAYA